MDASDVRKDSAAGAIQESVSEIARTLGVPIGNRLAQHAADKSHEDVVSDGKGAAKVGMQHLHRMPSLGRI